MRVGGPAGSTAQEPTHTETMQPTTHCNISRRRITDADRANRVQGGPDWMQSEHGNAPVPARIVLIAPCIRASRFRVTLQRKDFHSALRDRRIHGRLRDGNRGDVQALAPVETTNRLAESIDLLHGVAMVAVPMTPPQLAMRKKLATTIVHLGSDHQPASRRRGGGRRRRCRGLRTRCCAVARIEALEAGIATRRRVGLGARHGAARPRRSRPAARRDR
jgi:hypothetical protein